MLTFLRRSVYEFLDLEVYRLEDQLGSMDASSDAPPAGTTTREILLWKNKIWESKVSNAGDLAIIQNTILKLKRDVPEARVHLFSDDPDHVSKQYGVVAHPVSILRRPAALLSLLKRMDLVIVGGGTVLQDDYFAGIIPINLSIPLLAKALGKRIVFNAIGAGSQDELSFMGKVLCRLAVPKFDAISVRDPESQATLLAWTHGSPSVELTNDIAVDLPEADIAGLLPALREEGVDLTKPTVVIAARKVFHHEPTPLYFLPSSVRQRLGLQSAELKRRLDDFKNTLAGLCDHIIAQYDVNVLFMPFYSAGGGVDSDGREMPARWFSSGDAAFAADVRGRIKAQDRVRVLSRTYTPQEMLAIVARCQAMIGVPYHSVVFASSRNVPVLGIHYVSKVERYMRILDLEEFVVDAGAPQALYEEKFRRLWQERTTIAEKLARANPRLCRLADDNTRLIRKVLELPEKVEPPCEDAPLTDEPESDTRAPLPFRVAAPSNDVREIGMSAAGVYTDRGW